jgi:hypothetical protein
MSRSRTIAAALVVLALPIGAAVATGSVSAYAVAPVQHIVNAKSKCTSSTIPRIKKVSMITAAETQTITITGKCFGKNPDVPYSDADNDWFRIADNTSPRTWAGCHVTPTNYDAITCSVRRWTNTKIVFTGFSGAWGGDGGNWVLKAGDSVMVSVWKTSLPDSSTESTSNAGNWTGTVS